MVIGAQIWLPTPWRALPGQTCDSSLSPGLALSGHRRSRSVGRQPQPQACSSIEIEPCFVLGAVRAGDAAPLRVSGEGAWPAGSRPERGRGSFKKQPADREEAPGRPAGARSPLELRRRPSHPGSSKRGAPALIELVWRRRPRPRPQRWKSTGRRGPRPLAPPPGRLRPLPARPASPLPARAGPAAFQRPPRLRGAGRRLGVRARLRAPGLTCGRPGPPRTRPSGGWAGRARIFPGVAAPKELHGRSPCPTRGPGGGARTEIPRRRDPCAAPRHPRARGNPDPAGGWAGGKGGRPAGGARSAAGPAGRGRAEREPPGGRKAGRRPPARRPAGAPDGPGGLGSRAARKAPRPPPPTAPGSARSAPPLRERAPPPGLARWSSLVTAVTPRRAHLPRSLRRDRHPRACAHTLPHGCPPASAIAHTDTRTHTAARCSRGLAPRSHRTQADGRTDSGAGSARPSPSPLPCCSPRPGAGSAPRCAQVAFLKGKLHQPPEAQSRRESARPAAPLEAPPELVVFWFRGGGGQEFGESLESGEGLGDPAKSLPSLNGSPGCSPPPSPFHPHPTGRLLRLLLPGNKITRLSSFRMIDPQEPLGVGSAKEPPFFALALLPAAWGPWRKQLSLPTSD
eukprot:XP_022259292.1 basic proline-rich protein-like [Canis lupus familiaris]